MRLGFLIDESIVEKQLVEVKKLLLGFKNYIDKKVRSGIVKSE